MKRKVNIQANSNFHTATRTSVFDVKSGSEKFKQYRKRWHEYPANFTVGEFPIHLDIETTSFCNLRCPFCASTFDGWGPGEKGFIDFELFKKIIDEGVSRGLFSIKLSLRGEPLLHKQLVEMIDYAKRAGIIDVYFNTNATLLDEDMINKMIASKLDRISISFEGTEKDVYERYRVGARYEDVVKNIKMLRELRDKQKRLLPAIRIQTVLLPELKESFGDYVKFWQPIADEVSYLDAREESEKDHHCRQGELRESLKGDWACPFLWQRMMILWDGTVFPCLIHGVKDAQAMALGNVKDISLYEMWHSRAFNNHRHLHRTGRSHEIEACTKCSYRTMELEKLEKGS